MRIWPGLESMTAYPSHHAFHGISGYSGASLIIQLVKNPPAMQRPRFNFWVGKIRWRRDRLPTPVFLGLPGGSAGKESACDAADLGSVPGLGRSPGEGKGHPLQCSGLENSMDCIVHVVTKSRAQLSDFHNVYSSTQIFQLPKTKCNQMFPKAYE